MLLCDGQGRLSAAIAQIPADSYGIPAGLARRPIRYQLTMHVMPAQRRICDAAMRLTSEKGPCCCGCWRWTAFQGLARYVISPR